MSRRPPRGPQRPPDPRHALGALGETLAARHLEREGYRIIGRNVRADGVEIDLIARRGPWIVFVEVKTRSSRGCGSPEEAVDPRKQQRLRRGARAWLATVRGGRPRFDVIAVEADPQTGQLRLRHLEAAF